MNNIIKGIKLILSGLLLPFKSMNLLNNINNRIKDCNNIHSHRIDSINKRIDELDKRMLIHYKVEDRIQNRINEIELSLDSYNSLFNSFKDLLLRVSNIENNMRPKDLGTFNFINDKLTQPELDIIEAEAKGESVAREEYDYTSEQKAKDKQVQDRMRKDEAELIW